jgi:integrase/recombinase XerD
VAAGLRVSELVGVRLDDVTFTSRYLDLHVRGKGRKDRMLTLWKTVADSVRAWLAVRGQARVPELAVDPRDPIRCSIFRAETVSWGLR